MSAYRMSFRRLGQVRIAHSAVDSVKGFGGFRENNGKIGGILVRMQVKQLSKGEN